MPQGCRKRRRIGHMPRSMGFYPQTPRSEDTVYIQLEEIEAIRLVDYLGLTQEEAGKRMGVSRGTLWRILEAARRKVADALINGKAIVIVPGNNVVVDKRRR